MPAIIVSPASVTLQIETAKLRLAQAEVKVMWCQFYLASLEVQHVISLLQKAEPALKALARANA